MSNFARAPLAAVLGPTNTGKTHLAVERMMGHASGMIGFPLRLLAREVYDRVVAAKGSESVALITGEEKILPDKARWLLCTAESMPRDRDTAFVAIDEAQLAADPERGHVFTDRLLQMRGREETMILGSDSLRPMLSALTPDADIISRPRFSTLSYSGPKKLSRLPPRSAIVAFSAEEVYAVAEMLRRLRGGAAVVMGALSPRTRNAQVAMFQAGEVDYLVATDAIGMGLNMDVHHVAFASLRKFDGRRRRRLHIHEMAQIAGRAGRHQRDGTFGTLGLEGEDHARFTDEEVERIEAHEFPWLRQLYWREGDPRFDTLETLIADLEAKPQEDVLRAAPEAVDLAVLKTLADEGWVRERATGPAMVERLWATCGLPDFRKTGADGHARLVGRLFRHLSEGDGHIPAPVFAQEVGALENLAGDVETLAGRLAAIRIWAYVAHRADWLADPAKGAARTQAIEQRLSDALHDSLTQRFVDRRTTVLMRDIGAKGEEALPVQVDADGVVTVDDEPIGTISGFRFTVDAGTNHADTKRLLAAAERRLGGEWAERTAALVADGDEAFALVTEAGAPVSISWRGDAIAQLVAGKTLLEPAIVLDKNLAALTEDQRTRIAARLQGWLARTLRRILGPLRKIDTTLGAAGTAPAIRALLAPLVEAGGILPRKTALGPLGALDKEQRHRIGRLGLTIGALDIFHPKLLKPEAIRWRLALAAASADTPMPETPPPGATLLPEPKGQTLAAWRAAGFRGFAGQMLRIDMAERVARAAHDARDGKKPFAPDPALATSLGLSDAALARLMQALGFQPAMPADADGAPQWVWRGRRAPKARNRKPAPGNAFAKLAELDLGRS
ncbi:helicase [Parasphingopyxis algicola]|uniref:helicase-related protein n=1 Tax=Parasphingopyxis algicola TaxID=2026624 RepID=UPI0015A06FD8|nr:helicase-related protein [Parasphingopyxis algicola]QLC25764.1 helicase [Parasphingopyxis algicola]